MEKWAKNINEHILEEKNWMVNKSINVTIYIHYVCLVSHVQLFLTLWSVAHQAPLSLGILQARILEWVACPPSWDLPNPDQTQVSWFAGGFIALSANREAHTHYATAKSLQSCPTLCDRQATHQAPPSLGFSRQEHWSGLSFPSMHEREKWKWSRSVVQAPPSIGFSRQEPLPSSILIIEKCKWKSKNSR